jgi:hypothetical protein
MENNNLQNLKMGILLKGIQQETLEPQKQSIFKECGIGPHL